MGNNPLGVSTWTADQVAELTKLVAEGLFLRDVAAALNEKFGTAYAKNAVIGKMHRLGLSALNPPGRRYEKTGEKKPKPKKTPPKKQIVTFGNSRATRVYSSVQASEYKLRCVDIVPRNLPLTDLEPNACRYIPGDDLLYCGHPQLPGSSFCTPHHFLCWVAPRGRELRLVAA